ncbi:uncharacterized protein LOC142224794 [Haematobia irritans]|uniref:uncharacterized protein LOC142224794 n=1 Tax=Haematobia irritans TaxID=7368 RepID=UPI003F4F7162
MAVNTETLERLETNSHRFSVGLSSAIVRPIKEAEEKLKTGPDIKCFFLNQFCDRDQTALIISIGARQLVVSSAYFSHDDDIMPPPRIVRELPPPHTNSRGESLMECFLENQIVVHNRGKGHSFETRTRTEVLDLTFSNLTNAPTLSMERMITAPDDIERAANDLEHWLSRSFVKSCPISRPRNNKHQAWWNKDLMNIRKKSRKLYNVARKNGTEQAWNEYKECLREYKKETRKAKRNDFIRVIEELSNIKDTARLRKLLSKQLKFSGNLQKPIGTWTNYQSKD